MQFTVTQSGFNLPVGQYQAQFAGVTPYTPEPGSPGTQYGPAVMVNFTVLSGERAGEQVGKICSTKFSEKSNLGKFAMQLSGKSLDVGASFDFAAYVGTAGSILVAPNDDGNPAIQTFIRGVHPQVQPAPVQPIVQQMAAHPQVQPQTVTQQAAVPPQAVQQIAPVQPQYQEALAPQPAVTPPNPPFPAE